MPAISQTELPQDIRMTLVEAEYLSEYGGRLPPGTVVLVDEPTAERWRRKGIAVDSAETDKTLKEQKRAKLAALQAEIEALEHGGQPAIQPNRRVRGRG